MPLPLASAILFILSINAAAILVAVISYRLVESKILRLKSRFKPQWPAVETAR
jgi:peptidoglycan/LPS O-acetylase OafA/YrhL